MFNTTASGPVKNSELGIVQHVTSDFLPAEVQMLSLSELQELAADERRLAELLPLLPQYSCTATDQLRACEQLEQLTKVNLAKKREMEQKKRLVLEKYDELNEMKQELDEGMKQLAVLLEGCEITHLHERLSVAAVQAEEQAEAVAEDFLEGRISVEEFGRSYLSSRTLGYIRRIKEDKLQQQLPKSSKT